MSNEIIKQWSELGEKARSSLKKINTLNTKSIKQLTKLQMDMVSSCLEGSVKKVQGVGQVTSIEELMNLQSSLYKDLTEKVLENAQKSVQLAMETKSAMDDLLQAGLSKQVPVAAVIKKAVNKAPVKPTVKKTVAKKVVAKKLAAKPAVKKVVPTVAAKKAPVKATKSVVKKAPVKAAVKKTPVKKAVTANKTVAKKPVVRKAPVKAVAKRVPVKPAAVTAKPVTRKADSSTMPKPSARPSTEGDAKK